MFHVKRRRVLGFIALAALSAGILSGCVSDESRGWGAPVETEDSQVVSARKGKLDGVDTRTDPPPAWTATLSTPLSDNDTRLLTTAISPSDTPYQGDLLRIESEIVRVRSLDVNGTERELILDRGFAGTVASSHAAGAEIEAFRRAWRFPDDWHIREGAARGLDGIYATPLVDTDGIMYVGDYGGWLYAFDPAMANLDAANDDDEPDVATVDLGDPVIGGLALDEATGTVYVTAGEWVRAVSVERMKSSLAAGGGEIDFEAGFSFHTEGEIWSAPVIEDGVLYVTSLDGNLYALDPATGSVNWSFDAGNGLATTPVIVDDLILVAGFDDALFAVNKSSGEPAWEFAASNWILATPVVEGGTAYFGDFDGILHAVNVESGTEEWSLPLNRGIIRGSAAISGDFVVVGTDDGWLIGVNHTTQERAWETAIDTGIQADLVSSNDEVLMAPQSCVTLSGGEVRTYFRAVEAATGTLRRVEGLC